MAREDLPRRPRDPRTGESPDTPREARADDPTHGVDPRADRPEPSSQGAAPGERPGLTGEPAHRGAMQTAGSRSAAPAIWLVGLLGVLIIVAAIIWA